MRLLRRLKSEPETVPPTPQRDPRVGPDPVIDLNVPVANPELEEAVVRCMASGGAPADLEAMTVALARAVYWSPSCTAVHP